MQRKDRVLRILLILGLITFQTACGQTQTAQTEAAVEFDELLPQQTEPIIIRETQPETETAQEEMTTQTQAFADEEAIAYEVESAVYEAGDAIRIVYPQVKLDDAGLQDTLNENIRQTALAGASGDGVAAYELEYEVATKGTGLLSVIFRGSAAYEGAAYPVNIVLTMNLDMTTGENLQLKDYADVAQIVSALENSSGYEICSEGVDSADFAAFLNNGYVTDYAMTLLDYDVDFDNQALVPAGYSAVRDNRLVLFVEAEHAMGDYVELQFDSVMLQK